MGQLRKVADGLRPRFPQTARLLEDAAEGISYRHLLALEHQRQLHSTDPLERLNKRSSAGRTSWGIFEPAAVIRLIGHISSNRTTNGRSPSSATSARSRCGEPGPPSLSTTAQEILAAIA
ncbi:MAG: transposase [Vicinamibacterales bacterium]